MPEVTFMARPEQYFVVKAEAPWQELCIEGMEVPCVTTSDVELACDALQPLLARARVARVAGEDVATAVQQLGKWVTAIEKCETLRGSEGFCLVGASPQQPLGQISI